MLTIHSKVCYDIIVYKSKLAFSWVQFSEKEYLG